MLTESQHKTLQIIRDYIVANGFAPTISEILQEMKIKSRSLIQRNLRALETAGFIKLLPNKRRKEALQYLTNNEQFAILSIVRNRGAEACHTSFITLHSSRIAKLVK